MAWEKIYISKNEGSEIDVDGWNNFIELIGANNLDIALVENISDAMCVFGGLHPTGNDNMEYIIRAKGDHSAIGGASLVDNDNPRYGVFIDTDRETEQGERYRCHYFLVNFDDFQYPMVQFNFSFEGTGGNIRFNYDSTYDFSPANIYDALDLDGIRGLSGSQDWFPVTPAGNTFYDSRQYVTQSFVMGMNIPMFLTQADLLHYMETGEQINCLNTVPTVINTGSDKNKYCQTTIQSMKPNGHDKATLYDYYYSYNINADQDIVGYVADDTNPLNVRFKAKNEYSPISITYHHSNGETNIGILTGHEFNNLTAGQPDYYKWYGCSTEREHELFGGNICWGVFGRMNIYIFDDETDADDYFTTGDPTKAINYDSIDNYNQRDTLKTGEDAGDQLNQNNALIQGWTEPSLSNVYILNSTKMEQVAELVFPDVTTAGELPDQVKELKASLGLYGENPINDIIDIWHCPFNPNNLVERNTRNLWFGSYRSEISATHVTAHGKLSNFGACTISPIYNDFRDYDIEITLYLPYFGAVDLAPDIFIGKTLNIKVTADLRSHNVRYYIFADQTLIQYHDCAVGTCYPLMGQDVAGKANQVMHAYNSLQTAKRNTALTMGVNAIGMTTQLARGDVMGAVATGISNEQSRNNVALQEKQLAQDVKYTQPARSVVGNASPACSENDIPYPYIIFKIPQTVKPSLLRNTYGLPCNVITQLANVHGYTQIDNIQLQTSAPERIKADIIRRLQSGVYLP